MWGQRIHASLRPGRIEDELCLSVLLQHRVMMAHCDDPVRIPIRRHTNAEDCPVASKHDGCQGYNRKDDRKEHPPQAHSETWPSQVWDSPTRSRILSHEARL